MNYLKFSRYFNDNTIFVSVYILCGLFNYSYQIYVGKALEPEEYGIFGSLFAIIYFISVISNTIQTDVAWIVSKSKAEGHTGDIGLIINDSLRKFCLIGFVCFISITLMSQEILKIIKYNSILDVIIVGTVAFLSFLLPVTSGTLQGLQKFNSLALTNILTFLPKMIFGVIFIAIGYGVAGAISAVTLGMLIALIFSFITIYPLLEMKINQKGFYEFRRLYFYSISTTLVMLCLAVPSNYDVILSRYFFTSYDSGVYTAASVLGKIVLFLPYSISLVMFPKASEMHTLGNNALKLLNNSLKYTAILSGSVASLLIIFPESIGIIFNNRYLGSPMIIQLYAIMMFIFSLTTTIAYYCLAIKNLKFIYLISLCTAIEVAFIFIIHASPLQMVLELLIINLILFIIGYSLVIYNARKENNIG